MMFETTKENLIAHLVDDLGIKKNDMVFMHSGVVGLGLLENGLDTITEAFDEVLSEGLLVIPSFTYSWCNGEPYDPLITECPNGVGSYSRNVWKEDRFVRSHNPNFAVAALRNKFNKDLIGEIFNIGNTCFGEKSIFDHMYRLSKKCKGFILLLGGAHSDFPFRCAFIHYAEEKVGIPSRYLKKFYNPGNSDEYVNQLCRYLSRDEYILETGKSGAEYQFPIVPDYTLLGQDIVKSGLFVKKPFGYSATRMVPIREFCDFMCEKLIKIPDYCIKKEEIKMYNE